MGDRGVRAQLEVSGGGLDGERDRSVPSEQPPSEAQVHQRGGLHARFDVDDRRLEGDAHVPLAVPSGEGDGDRSVAEVGARHLNASPASRRHRRRAQLEACLGRGSYVEHEVEHLAVVGIGGREELDADRARSGGQLSRDRQSQGDRAAGVGEQGERPWRGRDAVRLEAVHDGRDRVDDVAGVVHRDGNLDDPTGDGRQDRLGEYRPHVRSPCVATQVRRGRCRRHAADAGGRRAARAWAPAPPRAVRGR